MLRFHPEISGFAVSSAEDASLNGQVKQTRSLKHTARSQPATQLDNGIRCVEIRFPSCLFS